MGAGLWPAVGRRLVGNDRHRIALEKRRIYALIPSTPPLVACGNFNDGFPETQGVWRLKGMEERNWSWQIRLDSLH